MCMVFFLGVYSVNSLAGGGASGATKTARGLLSDQGYGHHQKAAQWLK